MNRKLTKVVCLTLAVLVAAAFCGCAAKDTASSADGSFYDLKLGAEKEEITGKFGTDYEDAGSTPPRYYYNGLRLFDFLEKGTSTKLTVFLDTENQVYAYAYYIYDAVDGNYEKLKAELEGKFGAASEGDNGSEEWKDGDDTCSLIKMTDYVVIGKF